MEAIEDRKKEENKIEYDFKDFAEINKIQI